MSTYVHIKVTNQLDLVFDKCSNKLSTYSHIIVMYNKFQF